LKFFIASYFIDENYKSDEFMESERDEFGILDDD
jgi:hypothetical protein